MPPLPRPVIAALVVLLPLSITASCSDDATGPSAEGLELGLRNFVDQLGEEVYTPEFTVSASDPARFDDLDLVAVVWPDGAQSTTGAPEIRTAEGGGVEAVITGTARSYPLPDGLYGVTLHFGNRSTARFTHEAVLVPLPTPTRISLAHVRFASLPGAPRPQILGDASKA